MFERHKIRGIRRVRRKEVQELSKLPWVLDEALSDDTWEARVLPDGRALHLLRIEGAGNLYPSREALAQVVQQLNEDRAKARSGGGRFDPAKELLPPLDEFLRDVEKHAKSLGRVLRIPDEALDRSVESLDLVDKAVGRLRIAKRMTPEVFTPLTAYLGEVMRLVCDGRWGRLPAAIKKRRPVYDPAEYATWAAAEYAPLRAAGEVADRALKDALARPGDRAAQRAFDKAQQALHSASAPSTRPPPTLLRWEEYEERIDGHEHEPVIWAHDRVPVHPVAFLVRTLMERSTYGSLRTAVDGGLANYLIKKREAAATAPAQKDATDGER